MESEKSTRKAAGLPTAPGRRKLVLELLRKMPMPVDRAMIGKDVADHLRLTEAQRAITAPGVDYSYVDWMSGWACNDLKHIGVCEQPARGLYQLTELGQTISSDEVERLHRERIKISRSTKQGKSGDDPGPERDWVQPLLERLKTMSPTAFEHLAKVLLTSAGFDDVQVTGGSGDGGIDGIGMYRPSGFITFHTAFQCKRYQGTVGASAVRDFRGSFIGRSDRGIFITTGSFTRDARDEAARPGANPVDLIDGEALCDLLKEHKLGVKVTLRTVEDVVIDEGYFGQFEDSP